MLKSLWLPLALSGSLSGSLRLSLALSGFLWFAQALSGSLRLSLVRSGSLWLSIALRICLAHKALARLVASLLRYSTLSNNIGCICL